MTTINELFPNFWKNCFIPNFPRIGLGFDVATTTNAKSNPSAIAVCQECDGVYYMKLALVFKNRTPRIPLDIILHIARNLPYNLKIGKVCVDASSERFYATDLAKNLRRSGIACELVDSNKSIEYLGEKMNYKSYLGNLICSEFEDGKIAVPNLPWVKDNIRQVYRTKGTFGADVDASGNHADLFDAMKLARYAVDGKRGRATVDVPVNSRLRVRPDTSTHLIHNPQERTLYT